MSESSLTCLWEQNPLRNSLFQWTNDSKINFRDSPSVTCPIPYKPNGYAVNVNSVDKYITLNLDQLAPVSLTTSYNNADKCPIISGLGNGRFSGVDIIQADHCQRYAGGTVEETFCRDGVVYCNNSDTILDSSSSTSVSVCPPNSTIYINGEVIDGCEYNYTQKQ